MWDSDRGLSGGLSQLPAAGGTGGSGALPSNRGGASSRGKCQASAILGHCPAGRIGACCWRPGGSFRRKPRHASLPPPIPSESELKSSTIASQPTTAQPSPVLANSDQVSPKQESLPTSEVLKKELEELLQNMRTAQLNKDLDQYLNYYSTNFPDLDKKRQITAKNWEIYDYLDLEYKIDEVKLLITGNASALVTWKIKYRNKGSEDVKYITQKFNIMLSNEANKWRIRKLELITKP